MYQNQKSGRIVNLVIMLLVFVLVGLLLLAAVVVAADHVPAAGPAPSQSAASVPESIPQPAEPSQPELPEEPEMPESQPQPMPSSSSSQASYIPAPSGSQSVPVASSSAAPSGSTAASQSGSGATGYAAKTYSKSGSYEKKQTFGNVQLKVGDITLANKTIKGDLTIGRDAEGTIELVDCVVEGKLYVRGGQTIILTDSRVAEIVVKEGYGQPVTILADGASKSGVVTAYTAVTLDESGLDGSKSGFSELKVAKGDPTVLVNLVETELTKVTLNEETELNLDGSSNIRRLRANKPATIDGTGSIELLTVGSNGINSYILPDEEEKASKRYDDVTYLNHLPKVSTPANLQVAYTGSHFVLSWQGEDTNTLEYEIKLTADGTTETQKTPLTSLPLDDSYIGRQLTIALRALTAKDTHDHSDWASLTYTPRQVGDLTGFAVDSVGADGIHLKWNAAANAQSYTLRYQASGQTDYMEVNDLTGTSYVVGNPGSVTYTFTLTAVGEENTKPAAQPTQTLTVAVQKLVSPTLSGSYDADTNKLKFSWTEVENAGGYRTEGMTTVSKTARTGELIPVAGQNYTVGVVAEGYYNQTLNVCYLDSDKAWLTYRVEQTPAIENFSIQVTETADHIPTGMKTTWTWAANTAYTLFATVSSPDQPTEVKKIVPDRPTDEFVYPLEANVTVVITLRAQKAEEVGTGDAKVLYLPSRVQSDSYTA